MTSLARSSSVPPGCPDPGQHGLRRAVVFLPSGRDDYLASARMSLEEFLELDYEGGLAEWVNGEVFLYVSNKYSHQRVVDFLTFILQTALGALRAGVMATGPYAMVGPSRKAGREPDVMAVTWEHRHRVKDDFLDGIPDLVVEVTSDDSVRRDRVVKRREYERSGIPEYWIIDPREGEETAHFLVLVDGRYEEQAPGADGVYVSNVFPDLKFNVAWLFEEHPPVEDALKLVLGDRLR